MYVSYLNMGFLDIGNKKHQGQHQQEHLRLLLNDGDCVTFHRLTAYHQFLGLHFDGTLTSCGMRHGSELSSRDIELNLSKYATTNKNMSFCRVFVVFPTNSAGKQIHAKTIWLQPCV